MIDIYISASIKLLHESYKIVLVLLNGDFPWRDIISG